MKWYRVLVLLSMCSMLGAALVAQSHDCNGHDRGDLSSIISKSLFEQLLKHRGDGGCRGRFYTYEAFIEASKTFSDFATTGDIDARKRDVAAFLAQTSFETAGGFPKAYTHAYCLVENADKSGNYCVNPQYPCNPSQNYYPRGPTQLSYNHNYWLAGEYLGLDLINNPDLVATDPVISFKTALLPWMLPLWSKPSCHDVMTGQWTPSEADREAGRLRGFGVTTNILNGGLACGSGPNQEGRDRIGFYQRYCNALGVSAGANLDCYNQEPFRGGGICGVQGGGAVCPGGLCCSRWGFCGTSDEDCGAGCQSQCGGGGNFLLPTDI